jgi:YHS domain-containing protein
MRSTASDGRTTPSLRGTELWRDGPPRPWPSPAVRGLRRPVGVQDPHLGPIAPAAAAPAAATTMRDPVCGRQVDQPDPTLRSQYADQTYVFCSPACRDRFDEQPDIFTASPGRGQVAERDRAQRTDDDRGELQPGQPARLSNSPPTPGPG